MGTCKKILRKGCTWLPALAALALIAASAMPVFAQVNKKSATASPVRSAIQHFVPRTVPGPKPSTCNQGVGESKTCVSPLFAGDTTDCEIEIKNEDNCSNNLDIQTAVSGTNALPPPASCTTLPCDEVLNAHGGAAFQTGLTVSGVAGFTPTGNTTCTPGATSCVVGPACGGAGQPTCLAGVTSPAAAGDVFYRQNTYVVQALDPTPLNDAGFIVYSSECNFNTIGGVGGATCSTNQNTETVTTSAVIDTCGATLDKQVSCDGGTTWQDVTGVDDTSGTSNLGCIAAVGANVMFQFVVHNTGNTSITCDLGDSVTTILPSTTVTVGSGLSVTIAGTTTTCNLTGSQTGDNTATLNNCSCTVGSETGTAPPSTDTATYACCGVQLDKQVSCNGGAFTDVGLESNNEDGTNGCSAINGQTVAIQYDYKNTGNIPLVCSGTSTVDGVTTLGLIDVYNSTPQSCTTSADCQAGSGVCNTGTHLCEPFLLTGEGTLAGGVTSSFISNSSVTTCSSQLNSDEATGNTATIDCECAATSQFATPVSASADDAAQIGCSGTSSFTTLKTCTPTGTAGDFNTDINVVNTGTNGLSCAVVDQFVPGPCGTPPTCPLADVTDVPLTNNPIVLAGSPPTCTPGVNCTTGDATGSFGPVASSVCNQACVTCTPTGGTALTSVAVEANCPVGSCFSRTPGYWGTHPAQTAQVIALAGGSLDVCGQSLTTVDTSVGSAIQNLCESGRDFKAAGTSPQQLQLIRQCTAAALNLVAAGGGSVVAGEGSCEGLDPGITTTFDSCCDELGASVCNEGASKATINASACITELDAFNNQFDNTPFPSTITNSSAKPATCKASNGDGVTNCSSTGGTIDCGPAK